LRGIKLRLREQHPLLLLLLLLLLPRPPLPLQQQQRRGHQLRHERQAALVLGVYISFAINGKLQWL